VTHAEKRDTHLARDTEVIKDLKQTDLGTHPTPTNWNDTSRKKQTPSKGKET
jgi:hypothetical protein